MMSWKSCFVFLLAALSLSTSLNILSFNVRQFGTTKYSNQDVVNILIKIVQRYDLILIIELVDVSQTVLPGFVNQLNQDVAGSGIQYNYSVSQRVGRTHIKEQYAFIYKVDTLRVLNTYQYLDTDDVFERPPYAILVETINTENLPTFFLIASHTRPSDAQNEINHLDDVYDVVSTNFSNSRGMILGDLNADCSYLSQTRYRTLDLVVNTSFTWWIGNEVDTTTGNSDCTYDRIITSYELSEYVVNGSATVVLFDSQLKLNSSQTAAVSDHYPVQITLQGDTNGSGSTWNSLCYFVLVLLVLVTTLVM